MKGIVFSLLIGLILVGVVWYVLDMQEEKSLDDARAQIQTQVPRESDSRSPTPSTPSPSISPSTYSLAQLKSGDLDTILHCGGPLWDVNTYHSYLQTFSSTQPMMLVHFHSLVPPERFASAMDGLKKDAAKYPKTIPFESLTYSYDTDESGKPFAYDKDVAEGKFDDELRQVAQTLKAFKGPVFFRPAYEFNGWWNGYSKQYYAKAWQRTYNVFQEEEATNVIFVWTYEATGGNEPYMDFYPGDTYVDWWGIDVYGHTFSDPKVLQLTKQFLADAGKHGKPVIFPESGPHNFDINSQTTWTEWFAPYFQLMEDYPQIKGFCYTNHDFAGKEGWENIRIDTSALKQQWQQELSKTTYAHAE